MISALLARLRTEAARAAPTSSWAALVNQLDAFATPQGKNAATVVCKRCFTER
jgi:hypothetical protein